MDVQRAAAAVEAILFTMGESVEISRIADVLEIDLKEADEAVSYLKDKYERSESGIGIIELEAAVQLCTKKEFYPELIRIAKAPKKPVLTEALLETLSIVAYKQPVTKADIEAIRGVKSDHAVNKLIEYGLIEEAGRLQAPGKPLVFGTTEDFLRSFGIKSLEDLPSITQETEEIFKKEAEEEAQMSFEDFEKAD